MMDTKFGLRGDIVPAGALGDLAESFADGPFQISVNSGIIEIGYEDESAVRGCPRTYPAVHRCQFLLPGTSR